MAVKIRLRRMGQKKAPFYRIIVADSRSPRDGRFIEEIGTYDPSTDPSTFKINEELAKKWLQNGAQPTEQVAVLLKLTGDLAAAKGEKAENTVKPVDAKPEFVVPEKGSVVLPEAITPKAEEAPAEEAAEEAASEEAAE